MRCSWTKFCSVDCATRYRPEYSHDMPSLSQTDRQTNMTALIHRPGPWPVWGVAGTGRVPKAGVRCGEGFVGRGFSLPTGYGVWEGAASSPENVFEFLYQNGEFSCILGRN